ncbi:hypothetical protein [Brevibacillus laterosporus]|uniref:Uncharacterized protein n=1 Tax=Brevibacillus laterosporus TaxID=1465 RepID=A0AAP8QBS8_BRELA|nr:hypothetical protein [Brevibacillus laterosporus]PPA93247.1 hypothetical protein C4A77_19455 [Brevibacillus laterosporus]
MKKLTSGLIMGLALTFGTSSAFAIDLNQEKYQQESIQAPTLSQEEAQDELSRIADKYKVNEPVSKEDLAFLQAYAFKALTGKTVSASQVESWKVSGQNSNNVFKGSISGKVKLDLGIWENNISGTLETNISKGKPTQHKTNVKVVCYGVVGKSGVGKVADLDITDDWTTSSKSSFEFTFDRDFQASVAYYTITPSSTVKNDSGTLEIVGTGK